MGDDSDVTSSVSSASHPIVTPADNVDCKLYLPLQFVHFTEFKQLTAHTPLCYLRSVQRETKLR